MSFRIKLKESIDVKVMILGKKQWVGWVVMGAVTL